MLIRTGIDYLCVPKDLSVKSGIDYLCVPEDLSVRSGIDYLCVPEAQEEVKEKLRNIPNTVHKLYIITGRGNHSPDNTAKIKHPGVSASEQLHLQLERQIMAMS